MLTRFSYSAAAAALLVGLPAPAFADSLETVVITATRFAEPAGATGDVLTLITPEDLAARQVTALGDILATTPAAIVNRNGGLGQTTTVSLRGAEAGQTLLLVDGVRINDPSTVDNQGLFGDVLVNDLARVEILRGPQSALYGSDAIGGVINLVTRRGGDSPFALRALAEGGSFGTYKLNAGANGTLGDLDYGAAVQYLKTTGISAADARLGNPEPDGTGNLSATLNTRYHFGEHVSLDLRGYATRARTDFDDNYLPPAYQLSDSPAWQRNTLYMGYAGLNFELFGGALANRVSFSQTDSRRTTYNSPSYLPLIEDYAYHGTSQRIEYQGIAALGSASKVTFGIDTGRTALASQNSGFADPGGNRRTTGYYVEGLATPLGGLTLTAGARLEDNDEFGTHAAYKASALYTPDDGVTRLHATFGTGFKAPSLYQQFSAYSNPVMALAPETATGYDAGVDRQFLAGRITAGLTWFDRRTKQQIDFYSCYFVVSAACAVRPFGYYYNIGRSKAQGLEAQLSARILDTLSISANYTYLQATDEITRSVLARRPHDTASTILTWQPFARWSFGTDILFVGRRFDSAGDFNPQGSHTTADLFASYRVSGQFELYGRIENLFDTYYEPVAGYGAPGRAAYGGVRFTYN